MIITMSINIKRTKKLSNLSIIKSMTMLMVNVNRNYMMFKYVWTVFSVIWCIYPHMFRSNAVYYNIGYIEFGQLLGANINK